MRTGRPAGVTGTATRIPIGKADCWLPTLPDWIRVSEEVPGDDEASPVTTTSGVSSADGSAEETKEWNTK